jgi:hypothetical protein
MGELIRQLTIGVNSEQKKEDIIALADALHELFQENRDKVTPKQVTERNTSRRH